MKTNKKLKLFAGSVAMVFTLMVFNLSVSEAGKPGGSEDAGDGGGGSCADTLNSFCEDKRDGGHYYSCHEDCKIHSAHITCMGGKPAGNVNLQTVPDPSCTEGGGMVIRGDGGMMAVG